MVKLILRKGAGVDKEKLAGDGRIETRDLHVQTPSLFPLTNSGQYNKVLARQSTLVLSSSTRSSRHVRF